MRKILVIADTVRQAEEFIKAVRCHKPSECCIATEYYNIRGHEFPLVYLLQGTFPTTFYDANRLALIQQVLNRLHSLNGSTIITVSDWR